MMKLAINGYGRIGRSVLRALFESDKRQSMQIVAINEPADANTIAHLTKYDSTHGRFIDTVSLDGSCLSIGQQTIQLSHASALNELDWQGIDLVLECSGQFSDRASAEQHLKAGAKRVLFSQPAAADIDRTLVYGVNESSLQASDRIISAASCTTNCIIPVIQLLDQAFGIVTGTTTTIHSAMNDQPVIDAYHNTDLRKTRSAGQSIIPVNTGLAKGIARILPHLADCFTSQALRIPTWNVSAIDLVVQLQQPVSVNEVNEALCLAAEQRLQGIMACTHEPLASCDFNHDTRSVILDAGQTQVSRNGHLLKLLCWFDNEWAYANRMLDIASLIRQLS